MGNNVIINFRKFISPRLTRLEFVFAIALFSSCGFSQAENALPPGPARLHATLNVEGKPFNNATIIFFYQRDKTTHFTRYASNYDGRFTVYVFDDISHPVVAIFIDKKLRFIYEPMNFMSGSNYVEIFNVNLRTKKKIEHRPYRKTLKSIDL